MTTAYRIHTSVPLTERLRSEKCRDLQQCALALAPLDLQNVKMTLQEGWRGLSR